MGVDFVDVENIQIDEEVLQLVSSSIAKVHNLIPIEKSNNALKVAMSDPMNIFSIDDLRLTTGLEIIPCLGDEEQIVAQIDKYYGKVEKKEKEKRQEQSFAKLDEEIKEINEKLQVK